MQIPLTEEVGFISSGGGVDGGGGDDRGGGAGLLVLVYRYTGGGIVSARHISLLFVRVPSISPLLSRRRERRLNTFLLRSLTTKLSTVRARTSFSFTASSFLLSSWSLLHLLFFFLNLLDFRRKCRPSICPLT